MKRDIDETGFDHGPLYGCICHGPCDCGEAKPVHYAREASSEKDLCLFCGTEVSATGVCRRCKANNY